MGGSSALRANGFFADGQLAPAGGDDGCLPCVGSAPRRERLRSPMILKRNISKQPSHEYINPRRDKDKSVLLSADNDTELIARIA